MSSLVGNKPNQVPTNGDLGTMAFQDSDNAYIGNLTFTGTGKRITGDFSNATVANRVMFQNSVTNGNTVIGAIPNGTGLVAGSYWINNSDPTNAGAAYLRASTTDITLQSTITGTGTYLPMTFHTGGSERIRIDTSGNVLVTNPAGLGYGTGSGGTVTQATSKSTAVALNKPTGQITMNNAALAAGAEVFFFVTNTLVTTTDNVIVTPLNGAAAYTVRVYNLTAGGFGVGVKNVTGGSLSDALQINFAVIKGATS